MYRWPQCSSTYLPGSQWRGPYPYHLTRGCGVGQMTPGQMTISEASLLKAQQEQERGINWTEVLVGAVVGALVGLALGRIAR